MAKKNKKTKDADNKSTEKKVRKKKLNLNISIGVKKVEIILFTRTLAILLKSGMNIVDAIAVLEEQFTSGLQKAIGQVRQDVSGGLSLADSLVKHPKYFNSVFVGLVHAGESSGNLVDTLFRISEELEKDLALARKIQAASLSPSLIFMSLIALASLLAYYILPQLVVVFTSFDMELPLTTRMLLGLSIFVKDFGFLVVVAAVIFVFIMRFILRIEFIRPYWQGLLMHVPILGQFIIKVNLVRLNRILAVLLQSGVPISDALDVTIESLSNRVYKIYLRRIKAKVVAGQDLGEVIKNLNKKNYFPQLISQMISVGDKTGTLETNLFYLSEFYERDLDSISKNLTTIIEPILLIFVGIIVALVAIAIISPVYEFVSTLSHSI